MLYKLPLSFGFNHSRPSHINSIQIFVYILHKVHWQQKLVSRFSPQETRTFQNNCRLCVTFGSAWIRSVKRTDDGRTRDGQRTDEGRTKEGQMTNEGRTKNGQWTDKIRMKEGKRSNEGRTKNGQKSDEGRTKEWQRTDNFSVNQIKVNFSRMRKLFLFKQNSFQILKIT